MSNGFPVRFLNRHIRNVLESKRISKVNHMFMDLKRDL